MERTGEEGHGFDETRGPRDSTLQEPKATFWPLLRAVKKALRFKRVVSVEPVLFLFNMTSQVVWITSQDFMVEKACRVNLGNDEFVCENLRDLESEEVASQSLVSDFLMWRSILETSLRMVTVPVLGWWGDQRGYKGPLILSLSCLGLEAASYLVNSLFADWRLEVNLLGSFFYGFSGGTHALLMISFSLMAHQSSQRKRTLRMGILDGFYYLGSPIGLAVASPLFEAVGYAGVFASAVAAYASAVCWCAVRLSPNKTQPMQGPVERGGGPSFCAIDRISEAFYTTLRPRRGRTRKYILVCIAAMLLDSFVIWGESNVKYLFTEKALDWNYEEYSHYGSLSSFFTVIGALVVVPVITLNTQMSDSLMGLLGATSRSLERGFYAFATKPSRDWLMYVGSFAGIASSLAPIAIRSQISKLAFEDVGQVYSVMAVGESLLPFASAPIYNAIYEATLDTYPGAFYDLSLGINLCMLLAFMYLFSSMRSERRENATTSK